jgi:3-amino-5-hydroxybenzoic acid synthesis related protein
MPVYRAILFDLDGVIIDSMPAMRDAFKLAYRDVVDADASDEVLEPLFLHYCYYLGYAFRDIMDALELPYSMYEPFVRYSAQFKDRVRINDGIIPLLQDLHQDGVKLTIATGKDGYRARDLLSALNIAQYIDIVTGSDEVQHAKPAPDMLLFQMESLGVNADEAVMVGDSHADVEAGKSAGVTTIGVSWGYGSRADLAMADFIIDHPSQLLELIKAQTHT